RSHGRDDRNHHAFVAPQLRQQLSNLRRQIESEHAELADRVLRRNELAEAPRVVLAFGDRHTDGEAAFAAQDAERDGIPNRARVNVDAQLTAILHTLVVERQHDVPRLKPGTFRRPAWDDVREHHTGLGRDVKRFRDQRGHRLRKDANLAPPYATVFSDLTEHVADDVARGGEADALAAARLRVDERVDANQPALGID